MARTIDERIVQMTFNNQEFEDRAKTTISTLSKLKTATDTLANGDWLSQAAKNLASNGLQSLSVTTTKIADNFSVLEQIAVGALRRIGDQAVNTGEKLVKSLTLDQVSMGWKKYDDLTQSVQTLVNSTGKSVDEIDGYLKRLMWYSDETSFGFTDMTKALGTMVSSGGDIEKLIPMLMGVGNAVAYAGKGATEFSRVIYNLNQSYSMGYLSTLDWKSIEGASVSSKQLKEQLLAAAVNLKIITKEQAKLENFRDLMSDKVFTRDVMEQAFGAFAQMTLEAEKLVSEGAFKTTADAIESLSGRFDEFAERAFKSAQEAKSFKEAMDAIKDAVSSGWMQTFQYIFGDYEQAKALWTDFYDTLWEVFASGAQRRNNILKEWNNLWAEAQDRTRYLPDFMPEADDYKALSQIQALWNSISDAIIKIRDAIKGGINQIFEKEDVDIAKKLFDAIENIRKNLNNFEISDNFTAALKGILRGISFIGTVLGKIKTSFIDPLIDKIKPILSDISDIIGNIGRSISRTLLPIDKELPQLEQVLTGILNILSPIIDAIAGIVKWIKELTGQNTEINVFAGLITTIGNVFQTVGNAIKGIPAIFKDLGNSISIAFGKLKGVVGNFLESYGTDVSKIAEGGFLAYIILGLTTVVKKLKKLDLQKVLEGITNFFNKDDGTKGFLDTIQETFETLTTSLKTFTESIKTKMLDTIANSLIKLGAALLIISLVDSEKIGSSLSIMAGLLIEVVTALAAINKINPGASIMKSASAFSKISTGLLILAIAVKVVSGIDPQAMGTALVGLGSALVGLVAFMYVLNKMDPGVIEKSAKAFKKISSGLILLSVALKILASVKPEQMVTALELLGGTLFELMAFMVITSNGLDDRTGSKLVNIGKALTNMSVGLIAMAVALKIMATIDGDAMGKALIGLAAGLAAIGIFADALGSKDKGAGFAVVAASMLIFSVALVAFAGALALLGKMKLETIVKGLGGLVAGMVALGVLSSVFSSVIPFIALFSASILIFGEALISLSEGLINFMAAYALIQAMGGNFVSAFVDILTQATAAVIMVLPAMIAGVIDAVLQTADKIVELAVKLLDILIKTITEGLPRIIELGVGIIMAILIGVRDNIPQIITVALECIAAFITGLSQGLPTLMDAMLNFLIDAVNGLANAIRQHAGEWGAAVGNLGSAMVTGIIDGFTSAVGSFALGLVDGAKGIWDKFISFFGGSEAEEGNENAGETTIQQYQTGMENREPELIKKVDQIGENVTDTMDRAEDAKEAGDATIMGLIKSTLDPENQQMAYDAFFDFMQFPLRGMNDAAEIRSPSKKAMKTGNYIVEGLVAGLKGGTSTVYNAGASVGEMVADAISTAVDAANSILEDDLNPVITPVLDLSNIQDNAGSIANMLDANASLNGALAIGNNSYGLNQNGAYSNGGFNQITMNNTFEINGVQNMDRTQVKHMAEMLYDEINILLGSQV